MIQVQSLHKSFNTARPALQGVSFDVRQGEIVGLLGHNGAGKSTVLGIMLGMVRPDQGEVHLDGISVQKQRSTALRQVGAIFEAPSFYDYMSGWQNLRSLCALSGWWEAETVWRVLDLVNLRDRVHSKVSTYSHGMRQRLALAQALLPMPKVLLLDEPTDGLDPEGIHEFRTTVLKLRDQQGLTILLNSHLLNEVEQMCDRCVILRGGKKVYEGQVQATLTGKPRFHLEVAASDRERAVALLSRHGAVLDQRNLVELNDSAAQDGEAIGTELLRHLVTEGIAVRAWTPQKKTLEDWYMELTSGVAAAEN